MTEKEFVSYIGALAAEDMKKTGILASITAAKIIKGGGYATSIDYVSKLCNIIEK